MGFFSNLWSGIKSVGGSILGGVKSLGRGILNVGNTIRSGISKGLDIARKIPVVGGLVDEALNMPLPGVGVSLSEVGGIADTALNTVNNVADVVSNASDVIESAKRGDLEGVVANAQSTYQRGRAVVDSAKDTQDAYRNVRNRRQFIIRGR